MVKCSWSSAIRTPIVVGHMVVGYGYIVSGFKIEALVQNIGAQQTGVEIAVILLAIGFIALVVAIIVVGSWVTWKVITAVEQAFGPIGVVIVGGVILVGIGLLLFTIFGGKAQYKGEKRSFRIGRSE